MSEPLKIEEILRLSAGLLEKSIDQPHLTLDRDELGALVVLLRSAAGTIEVMKDKEMDKTREFLKARAEVPYAEGERGR